ncbi:MULTISPECIES: ABC transporter permease [Virgibacillus]|uniref:Transport permease protein n=2 Tax=Virgibacillus TaxID=84406 RepID=A0A024QF15_9BACI|nr:MULTISPECIES: ABC transporter permease [Virgibacillus]EQB38955.1 hypothetical protein M948_01000 [Virgibacillus sp. CM-4]MYL43316.1 ABC transporter permease [Virgibacillus massiliensis]GGJ67448.1 hypothetical protein GCM10007111_31690 [Virgibacillus kapii]CDQ41079.1 daunorubicin resistance ABC transporter membrane protein [Virgibacillus massiliensis]
MTSALFHMETIKNLQDRGLIFWMLILPIIFTVLFISIFTAKAAEEIKQQVILSIVPGYVVMFVFFILITMTATFIKDRDNGIAARISSTPAPSYAYLLGKWMPYFVIVLIQITILFLFGKAVYTIPLEQPLFISIISICLTFTVTGLGLALALLVKTNNMGLAITQIIALGGALLSGLWVPMDMMPTIFQIIGKLMPQYWAHQGLRGAMDGTLEWRQFIMVLSILFAFGAAGFITALLRYPYFLKQAKG